jgi:hypothetical protein
MSNYGIKVSKIGVDVKTAGLKDLSFASHVDFTKIRRTGELELSLPSETFGAVATQSVRTQTYNHTIGDISFFLPRITGLVAYTNADVITGASYVVNDLEESDIPVLGYGVGVGEFVDLTCSSSNLTLRVTRFNLLGSDVTFGARTATVFYTLFWNRADEEVDYL